MTAPATQGREPIHVSARLHPADVELLLELLRTPTVAPLELGDGDAPPQLWDAQRAYAQASEAVGMATVWHGAAQARDVDRDDVPLRVREAAGADPRFLAEQPSLVLRLGEPLAQIDTVMFNVHLDTVAGAPAVAFDGTRIHGRGAVDAKGPAVALLAGIRAAAAADPSIGRDVSVLVQAVAGEEGGAMGTIGTRPLVERGLVGRLNVFCEPTRLRYLPRATASMTARVRVDGDDASDDRPQRGHNATVLLGYLAQHLALTLADGRTGERVCVAGLHTGRLHNRVYGRGELLVNLSYGERARARALSEAFERRLEDAIASFAGRFAAHPTLARTARDAAAVTRVDWLKRDLPALDNDDRWCEELLHRAGIERWPDAEDPFTCDAIWMADVAGAFTVVLGPGDLAANGAHADDEHVDLADLEAFARAVAGTLIAFSRARADAVRDGR